MVHVRVPLFEDRRMRPERAARAYWPAVYTLWNLSWFTVNPRKRVPRLVMLETWLCSFRDLVRSMHKFQNATVRSGSSRDSAVSGMSVNPNDPGNFIKVPLSAWELAHVAGGLIKSGFASTRFLWVKHWDLQQHGTQGVVGYVIDPSAAVHIHNYLNHTVEDQRLRPGVPGSHDHLLALRNVEQGIGVRARWAGSGFESLPCYHGLIARCHLSRAVARADKMVGIVVSETADKQERKRQRTRQATAQAP